MYPQKRKQSVLEKTPVSILQELCDQQNVALSFEVSFDSNSQMFVCEVKALNVIANVLGRSKKEAKHKACADVICE